MVRPSRALCENPESSDLNSLTSRLDAIGAGLRLRRQLDGLGPDEPIESSRREVVRRLTELQLLADLAMTKPCTGHSRATTMSRPGSRRGWLMYGRRSATF